LADATSSTTAPYSSYSAHILWQASNHSDINALCGTLSQDYSDSSLTAVALYTGIDSNRKVVLVSSNETITLAFKGSGSDGLHMNMWTMAKGPNACDLHILCTTMATVCTVSIAICSRGTSSSIRRAFESCRGYSCERRSTKAGSCRWLLDGRWRRHVSTSST
jgi:hypothetical protein